MIDFINTLKTRNEILFYFGLICFLAAMACLVFTITTKIDVLGINAFYKPMKFFIATAVFVWTMGWYGHYLDKPNLMFYYSWLLVILFTIENIYIFTQAARGELSHFNVKTSIHQTMWITMFFCAASISVATLVILFQFFITDLKTLPSHYVLAIQMGLIMFVVFSFQGMMMGSRMAHTVGAADGSEGLAIVNWSKRHGDLRVAHFFGMHALQLIPLLSFYLFKTKVLTIIVALLYCSFVVFTLVQALRGKSLLAS